MKLGAKIFGGLSIVLLLFLLIGIALPGTWRAEQEALFPGTPADVFPFLNSLLAWEAWTPFPEAGLESFGPAEGIGAGIRWDDPQYGRGEAQITGSSAGREVSYEVKIEDGRLTIQGRMTLLSEAGGVRIRWVEEGDFGWNPLMGYASNGMAGAQGEAMGASLERLRVLVGGG